MGRRRDAHVKRLEPVPIISPPERWSQTILDKADKCKRSAYLYQKHRGGSVGHQLDRGSLFHLFAAKATNLLIEEFDRNGAMVLGDIKTPIDWDTRRANTVIEILPGGRRRPGAPVEVEIDIVKELLHECYAEHPDLTVPLSERDAIREMAYHWAAYPVINPAQVVAVERKFVCDLPNGHRISGIIDVAEIEGDTLRVRDYKTQWDLPTWNEYANTFQGRFYAVLATFGHPVQDVFCSACGGTGRDEGLLGTHLADYGPCADCAGRGYFEITEPSIGDRVRFADVGEVYPRRLFENEGMPVRNLPLTRLQIEDIRDDLCDQTAALAEHFSSGDFPAVDGHHCHRCPARAECPLPAELRSFAGLINEPEEAAESASWVEMMDAKVKATRRELKAWARANGGRVRFGRDRVMEFDVREGWSTVKWDQVEADIEKARRYGEPFDLSRHRKPRQSNTFGVRVLSPAEIEAEKEQTA